MTASEQEPTDSPFHTVSDIEVTRRERLETGFQKKVAAPMRILIEDPRGAFGLFTVLVYILAGTVGLMVISPPQNGGPILQMPFETMQYPLGTDRYGASILAQLVYATTPMLKMITGGAIFTISMATIVGTLSGYKGGRTDEVLMMISDAVLAIPGLPLIIVLGVVLEPRNPFVVGLVISLPRWAGLARALRSEVLSLREESFVQVSKINGFSSPSILKNELIPNLMPYITINFVNAARGVIFGSVALYFLDILPSASLNWGVMMNRAYTSTGALYSFETAHWLILPMMAIVWLSFGLVMLGQAADKIFNPRLKARHVEHPDE